jgi:hypothetical protein
MTTSTNPSVFCWCGKELKAYVSNAASGQIGTMSIWHTDGTEACPEPVFCWCGKLLKASASDDFGYQDGTMRYIHDDDTESCPDPAWLLQRNKELETKLEVSDKRIDALEEENASLVSWQCPFQDGKTGLTSDEHGHQYCAKKKRLDWLDKKSDELVTIHSFPFIGGERNGEIEWCLEHYNDTLASLLTFTGKTIRDVIDKAMQADEERSE